MTAALDAPVRRSFAPRLRELTRAAITTTDSPDPHVVARAVLDELTDAQCREALDVTLADWVRNQMGSAGRTTRAAQPGHATNPAAARSWYARTLRSPLFCGEGWKFLSDCTAEDLHMAAAERYRKATETHAEGDRWTKVALFMEEHDRTTVASVREDELKQLMEANR